MHYDEASSMQLGKECKIQILSCQMVHLPLSSYHGMLTERVLILSPFNPETGINFKFFSLKPILFKTRSTLCWRSVNAR